MSKRALYMNGSIWDDENEAITEKCQLVSAFWGSKESVTRAKLITDGGSGQGEVGYALELGLLRPNSRTTSAAYKIWDDAKRRGLLSTEYLDGRQCIRLNDAYKLDRHLRMVANILMNAPEVDACNRIMLDSTVWSYGDLRERLGAPTEDFNEWCQWRMAAFWGGLTRPKVLSLNSWGDSVWGADFLSDTRLGMRSFEAGWTWEIGRYGSGQEKLNFFLQNILASLRNGVDVIIRWNPRTGWTEDEVVEHMWAGCLIYRWISFLANWVGYSGQLYWCGDAYLGGRVIPEDEMPTWTWLLDVDVDHASLGPNLVWLKLADGRVLQLVLPEDGSIAKPLSVKETRV